MLKTLLITHNKLLIFVLIFVLILSAINITIMPNPEGKTTVSFTVDRQIADDWKRRVKSDHPNERVQSQKIERFMDLHSMYGDDIFDVLEKNYQKT